MWLSIGCILQQISRSCSSCIADTLYTLISDSLFFPPCSPRWPPFYSLLQWVWLSDIPHTHIFMQYLSLCDWLILYNTLKIHPEPLFWRVMSRALTQYSGSINHIWHRFACFFPFSLITAICSVKIQRSAMTAVIGILWAICKIPSDLISQHGHGWYLPGDWRRQSRLWSESPLILLVMIV